MHLLFGLQLHWGEPKHPTEFRSWTGALGSNDQPWQHHYTSHPIRRWYGLSHKLDWFIGLHLVGPVDRYRNQDRPRFGWGAEIGERPSDIPMADEAEPALNREEAGRHG